MASDEEVQNALLAIHSRLGAIEGKVNLVARAEREQIRGLLKETVKDDPLIGQIYLLLDGVRTQKDIVEKLAEYGVTPSQPTVSRRMAAMETEHGIADLVEGGNTKIYRKDVAMENVLNLTRNIRKWLADDKQTVPEESTRRKRKPS
jgi:hypothetical protein